MVHKILIFGLIFLTSFTVPEKKFDLHDYRSNRIENFLPQTDSQEEENVLYFPLIVQNTVPDPPLDGYQTYPELNDAYDVEVISPAAGTAEGYIFIGHQHNDIQILDDSGEPIFIELVSAGGIHDFKRQTVSGVDYLTHWVNGSFYVLDESYETVGHWYMQDHTADPHDFLLLDNGNVIMLSYTRIPYDLSLYGGPANGEIVDIVIQEMDPDRNVLFEWHGSHHIPITETYQSLSRSPVDFMHTNAIEIDDDSNLLISNRTLSNVIKIDRTSGEIIWRLGGKSNDFNIIDGDIGFSYQHDIRRIANGNITIFDNGNQHTPRHSRAIEYEIDEENLEIRRIWQYPADTSIFSQAMGNAQRLGNGNTMIGWGTRVPDTVTEVHPDGTKALEFLLEHKSYRAHRFTWEAVPSEPPRSAVISNEPSTAYIYSAWNGATDISGYEIYAGTDPESMSLIVIMERAGFESSISLTGLDSDICVFKTRPISDISSDNPFSNIVYRDKIPGCEPP